MSLLELFCHVDDFWLAFAPAWKQTLLQSGQIKRQRSGQLVESEIMTILNWVRTRRVATLTGCTFPHPPRRTRHASFPAPWLSVILYPAFAFALRCLFR